MAKQKAPTLAELRKLAREVWGGANVMVSQWRPSDTCPYWTITVGTFHTGASADHKHGPTARRMLHAALLAAKKAGA